MFRRWVPLRREGVNGRSALHEAFTKPNRELFGDLDATDKNLGQQMRRF